MLLTLKMFSKWCSVVRVEVEEIKIEEVVVEVEVEYEIISYYDFKRHPGKNPTKIE